MNQTSLPEMREYWQRMGHQVRYFYPNPYVIAMKCTLIKLQKPKLSDLDRLRAIHVSGTKGKGSTCAFADAILRQRGLRTGLYTSPHLVEVRERIRLDGKPLPREMFAKYFFEVFGALQAVRRARIHLKYLESENIC